MLNSILATGNFSGIGFEQGFDQGLARGVSQGGQ
jgi:hypothetical protein